MKKVIIGFAISLILLTATPVSAVGFREWDKAVNDIATLQEQQVQNEAKILTLTTKVAQLEQENISLKNRVGLVEGLFNQLRGLLVQLIQMLSTLNK